MKSWNQEHSVVVKDITHLPMEDITHMPWKYLFIHSLSTLTFSLRSILFTLFIHPRLRLILLYRERWIKCVGHVVKVFFNGPLHYLVWEFFTVAHCFIYRLPDSWFMRCHGFVTLFWRAFNAGKTLKIM